MLITKNAAYLHVPKTGGYWVKHVLGSKIEYWKQHAIPTKGYLRPFVFSFVRNPWDWHVSLFKFTQAGSELFQFPTNFTTPIIQCLPVTRTFDDFLNAMCNPTEDFKRRTHAFSRIQLMTRLSNQHELKNFELQVTDDIAAQTMLEWSKSNVGYYELVFKRHAEVSTRVGLYENIREELTSMTKLAGDLTPSIEKLIKDTPGINVTNSREDYRTYYNDKQIELVYNSTRFLDQYGYTF